MALPQSSYNYTILPEQGQEGDRNHKSHDIFVHLPSLIDALHATRLLQVEERPFQRVTRNLLGKDSLLKWTPRQLPSPPPEDRDTEAPTHDPGDESAKRQKFREDILLDFAALESSIVRIQLIQASNARERERYAAEKAKIVETAQAVRDNTMELRAQLAEAQRVLALRKGYDELAAKLIDSQKLNKRSETSEEINKLEKEIEDLEHESGEFEGVWMGRREAFDKVAAEGQNLVKLIKGIKDDPEPEHEKDDAMEEVEEAAKGDRSRMGTPAPEGSTPRPGALGGQTPMPETADADGASPMRPSNKFLAVEGADTRDNSRRGSPMLQPTEVDQDVDMAEGEASLDAEKNTEADQYVDTEPKAETDLVTTDEQVAMPIEIMDES